MILVKKVYDNFIYSPPQTSLNKVYQDNDLIVVEKPSGLLSTPGRLPEHRDSVLTRCQEEFSRIQLVHRLDMATSGLLILAMNKVAERSLKNQFSNRTVKKVYFAEVNGVMQNNFGQINEPLICDWPNRPKQKICYEYGKPSITNFEVIKRFDKTSLVKLTPITGRSHQLRVHMMSIGHPILGDRFYSQDQNAQDMHLHAFSLDFCHPLTQKKIKVVSSCPFHKNFCIND